MTYANILIVEDDQAIQDMMTYALEPEGYRIFSALDVKDAWATLEKKTLDLVLLDWMLPDQSGLDLLRRIRKYQSNLPVIMVTAKNEEDEKILGLDVGADDYITKPFSVRELKSRIQAVLRRTMPGEQPILVGALFLDPVSQRVRIHDETINLAPTEFRLLHYLMSHMDRAFSRAQLLDQVWGDQVYVEERTVDVHVRRVRKHLEKYGLSKLIQTVHGLGYRFSQHQ